MKVKNSQKKCSHLIFYFHSYAIFPQAPNYHLMLPITRLAYLILACMELKGRQLGMKSETFLGNS